MMNGDCDEFLAAIERENALSDTTKAQKEANEHRRRLYLHFINKKPNSWDSANNNDLAQEMHTNRAMNPSYRLSISEMMKEEPTQ